MTAIVKIISYNAEICLFLLFDRPGEGNGASCGTWADTGFQGCKKQVQQVLGLIDHGRAVGKPIFHADEVKNHHKEDADGYAGGKQARFSFKDVMFIQK
ncbi:hypothetical protein CLOSTHATH_04881 [Hungatella hathewayi DSM 13479]|uniref:Uncharacterized protein n=1 Tax=Hungatella hathewayi DSM 13479 TaxID=566550 RepID=D3AMN1_9FIRM|nr:hypothetical protein CLOSTHATH_04881 [Hungatella hathewayi DSM 13479]